MLQASPSSSSSSPRCSAVFLTQFAAFGLQDSDPLNRPRASLFIYLFTLDFPDVHSRSIVPGPRLRSVGPSPYTLPPSLPPSLPPATADWSQVWSAVSRFSAASKCLIRGREPSRGHFLSPSRRRCSSWPRLLSPLSQTLAPAVVRGAPPPKHPPPSTTHTACYTGVTATHTHTRWGGLTYRWRCTLAGIFFFFVYFKGIIKINEYLNINMPEILSNIRSEQVRRNNTVANTYEKLRTFADTNEKCKKNKQKKAEKLTLKVTKGTWPMKVIGTICAALSSALFCLCAQLNLPASSLLTQAGNFTLHFMFLHFCISAGSPAAWEELTQSPHYTTININGVNYSSREDFYT